MTNLKEQILFSKDIIQCGVKDYDTSPPEGSICFFELSLLDDKGNTLFADVVGQQQLEIFTDNSTIYPYPYPLIKECLLSMALQEIAEFSVGVEKERLQIHLQKVERFPEEVYRFNNFQKLQKAKYYKELGVKLFKKNQVERAFKAFSNSLKLLLFLSSDIEMTEAKSLKCLCYLNLAACQLKCQTALDNVINCTKALGLNPQNIKGYVRRAQGYIAKGDDISAKADLEKALTIEPKNKFVKRLLQHLHANEK